jgi:hypothetical protein
MTEIDVKDCIVKARSIRKESPEPLRKKDTETSDFPAEILPQVIRNAIFGLHSKIQAPVSICAQSVLAAVNLAVQNHANIELPIGQVRPLSCFFLTIAHSGERKTSCDNEIAKYIEQHEKLLREKHKEQYKAWKNSFEAWEKQRAQILADKGKYPDWKSKESALNFLGEEPAAPLDPTLICSEPTYEGLCKLMAIGQPSIGIFSSEGGQFLHGHSMKSENKLRTAAALSDLWDGKPIKRIRSTELGNNSGVMTISGKRLCFHLMIQPNIAASFLGDDELRDQGLLSRMLLVAPKSAAGSRFYRNISELNQETIELFGQCLLNILQSNNQVNEQSHDQTNRQEKEHSLRTIKFELEAKKLFFSFSDSVEQRIASDAEFEAIKGLANKLPEHAARIAATIALFYNIHTDLLEMEHLQIGIRIAEYYAKEALRLAACAESDSKIVLAEKLISWLHNCWKQEFVSLPDIYQNINLLSTKNKAAEIVAILVDHGWLIKTIEPKIINNQIRRDVWKVIKEEEST